MGPELKLYNHCIESVKKYCEKYNIDHIIQKEPILKIVPDKAVTNRSDSSYGRLGYLPIYEKKTHLIILTDMIKLQL